MMIKGTSVILHVKTQTGTDEFNMPIYSETFVNVDNVIIYPDSSGAAASKTDLTGKTVAYKLGIPKGDDHVWTDTQVEFGGYTYNTLGIPKEFMTENMPLDWDREVKVERYV